MNGRGNSAKADVPVLIRFRGTESSGRRQIIPRHHTITKNGSRRLYTYIIKDVMRTFD